MMTMWRCGDALRVAVGEALGEVLGQVLVDAAAVHDVHLLHPQADAQDGHLALLDELAEEAVGVLAALGDLLDRRVGREAHLLGVEVVPLGQDHAVEHVEDGAEVGLPGQGRDDHGHGAGGEQALVVARLDDGERASCPWPG